MMSRKNNLRCLLLLISLFAIAGCGEQKPGAADDTPTSGSINVTFDETLAPVLQSELDVFHSIYKYAKISAAFKAEAAAMQDLINDSARIIVIGRQLTAEEKAIFNAQKYYPRQTKFAYDAVAVLVNRQNPDSLFSIEQIKQMISGSVTNWGQISKKGRKDPIQLVFDSKNSGLLYYLMRQAGTQTVGRNNSFAQQSTDQVISYVQANPSAIGFIGASWIGDSDDSVAMAKRARVTVAEISPPDTSKGSGYFYKPHQAFIAQKFYPLVREVYIISREARAGLGTGFAAFLAGEKGQRIVLKMGMIPANMPIRLVEVYNQNLEITRD